MSFSGGGGDIRLAGTLTVPPGEGPFPAVVLLSGSGPQDREGETAGFLPDHQPSRLIAEHLAKAGIASLRHDERGVGASTGSQASASTADLADDAEAALAYLRSRAEIAPDGVGLLGQSEGASIAAMVAARNPDVAFVVSLAGPAIKGHELVLAQSEHALRNSGLSGPDLEAAMAGVGREYDLVLNEEWEAIGAAMRAMLPAQLEAMAPGQRALLGTPEEIIAEELVRMRTWTRFFLTHDPAGDWARIRVPVLALFGELDVQVTVAQNRAPLEPALRAAPTEDWTLRVWPGANHLFQDAETGNPDEYFRLDPVIAPEVLDREIGISNALLRAETRQGEAFGRASRRRVGDGGGVRGPGRRRGTVEARGRPDPMGIGTRRMFGWAVGGGLVPGSGGSRGWGRLRAELGGRDVEVRGLDLVDVHVLRIHPRRGLRLLRPLPPAVRVGRPCVPR